MTRIAADSGAPRMVAIGLPAVKVANAWPRLGAGNHSVR